MLHDVRNLGLPKACQLLPIINGQVVLVVGEAMTKPLIKTMMPVCVCAEGVGGGGGGVGVDNVVVDGVLPNKVWKIILRPMVSPRRLQRKSVPQGIPCLSTPF